MTQEQFFSRYKYDRIKDRVGGGGFGNVYKVFDTIENETVALKIAEVKQGQESLSLLKEVELASSLKRHVNIARYTACYRFDLPNGHFDFGILQYYPLGNLSQLVKSKKLTHIEKEQIAKGVISGIQHLHTNNIVHRDLKSANILIAEGYQGEYVPKIADFGLSKQFAQNENSYFSNSFAGGSLLYVAPEQLEGKDLRKNVDLWSLGVVLYELFLGETPFRTSVDDGSETARAEIISNIKNASIPQAVSTIPSKWQEVILGCLVTDPTRRTKSIEEVISKVNIEEGITSGTMVDQQDELLKEKENAPKPEPGGESEPTPKWLYYLILFIAVSVAVIMMMRSCGKEEESRGLEVYEDSNRYGYKDAKGAVVISAKYETASPFSGGRAMVGIRDSVYFINERGAIVDLIKPKVETSADDTKPLNSAVKEETDWQQVKLANNKTAYGQYIRDYPNGIHVSAARNKIRDIEDQERKKQELKPNKEPKIKMLPIPDACGMLSQTWIKNTLELKITNISIKKAEENEDTPAKSCFFKWEDPNTSHAGIFIQIMTNPVYDEFDQWVSYFVNAKVSEGEVIQGSDEVYFYKRYNAGIYKGVYSYDLKKFYWNKGDDYLFMLAFNLDISESKMLSYAEKISAKVNENFELKIAELK